MSDPVIKLHKTTANCDEWRMHWSTFGKINILNGIWWEFIETLKLKFKPNQGNFQRQEDLENLHHR